MLNKIKKSNSEGFTIIEVMIVLAIAALILLIVFLAVPALQRTSRNTQRKNDVAAIGSAVAEYVNNNGGTLPTTSGQFTTEFTGENPKLSIYTTATNINYTYEAAAPSAGTLSGIAGALDTNKVAIVSYTTCSGNAPAAGATAQQTAILYQIESSSGNGLPQCITAN